jgi:hypothetical protein
MSNNGASLDTTLSILVGGTVRFEAELNEIKARFRDGSITEETALREMVEVVSKDPEVLALIERGVSERAPGVPRPRLNPLVEAALIERAQFDGDIPELRTGMLERGIAPAVPVNLTGPSAVAAGLMLQHASDAMLKRVEAHEVARVGEINRMLEAALPAMEKTVTDLVKSQGPDVMALVRGTPDTDLPEYRRGQLPALMKIATPTGAELAALTPAERQQAAWKLLSTTQGRRSAKPVIERLIGEDMAKHKLTATFREPTENLITPMATHEWIVHMTGAATTQSSFNFIEIAARVLSAGLRSKMPKDNPVSHVCVEVATVNRISDREVGWTARMFPEF